MTTPYTYEPAFKLLDTITDPLNHVTDLDDGGEGLGTITDGALRTTLLGCNGAGKDHVGADARTK